MFRKISDIQNFIKNNFYTIKFIWSSICRTIKNNILKSIIFAAIILVVIVFGICIYIESQVTISQVSINHTEITLSPDETAELYATVLLSNNKQNSKVTWSTNNPDVVSIDKFGNITAHEKGTAEITAQAKHFGKFATAVCTVNVKTAPTGYSILLSTDEASTSEIVKVYVNTLPEDEVTNITVCAEAPSGEIFARQLSDDGYYFYTETGTWKIYAVIENSTGSYTGTKPDEIAYLDVSGKTYSKMDDLPGMILGSNSDIFSELFKQ